MENAIITTVYNKLKIRLSTQKQDNGSAIHVVDSTLFKSAFHTYTYTEAFSVFESLRLNPSVKSSLCYKIHCTFIMLPFLKVWF